jgi:hypothetical protein
MRYPVVQKGSLSFRWLVFDINSPGLSIPPVFFGGAGVIGGEFYEVANSELFSVVTGKNVLFAGYLMIEIGGRRGASTIVKVSAEKDTASILYPSNRPDGLHLSRILSRHVCTVGGIRFSSASSPYDIYLRSLVLYLVEVNPFRPEEANILVASSRFSPDQFQSGVLDVDFAKVTGKPLVLTPERLLVIDINQNAVDAIPQSGQIMSVNFKDVTLKPICC